MKKIILSIILSLIFSTSAYASYSECTATSNLASAALDKTCDFQQKEGDEYGQFPAEVKLSQVLINASTAITEDITVTFDSANGANYDVVLDETSLSSNSEYVFRPSGDVVLRKGDKIRVQVTNGNTTGVVYLTVQVKRSDN